MKPRAMWKYVLNQNKLLILYLLVVTFFFLNTRLTNTQVISQHQILTQLH